MATIEYTCVLCGETYESDRTEEDAIREAKFIWGESSKEKMDIVCDDCFPKALTWQGKFIGRA